MFARVLEFIAKPEKREEFTQVVKSEVLPILRKQHGFQELWLLLPEMNGEKGMTITLWVEPKDADRYHERCFPRVNAMLRPYLATPIAFRTYMVETTVCEHFERLLVA